VIRIGKPPYLECSSRGDKRFSAFYAKVNGKSIEDQYQAAKIFEDGSRGLTWKEAKGRKPINHDEISKLYKELWKQYLLNNLTLLRGIKQASGLSDMFGQEGHNCQALTLWELRNEL